MADSLQIQNLKKQAFVDILYEFQCCIVDDGIELEKEDLIGSNCYSKDFLKLAELEIMLDLISCYDIIHMECITIEELTKILKYLKKKCNNCCIDIKEIL